MERETARDRDPRLVAGMARQLAARAAAIDAGARPLGWKVALGAPASQQAAGIDQRVVGFLTDRTVLADGASISVGDWTQPKIEGEIAIHLVADLPADPDDATAGAAIGALAAAIEVVDTAHPLSELEQLLAGGIFHRHVVLGPPVEARAGGDDSGIVVTAALDGEEVARAEDPRSVIGGSPAEIVQFVAAQLALDGLSLRAGDVIIGGSAIPLTPVAPGQRLRLEVAPLGVLELSFTP
jgi:2-keto-4-pentenoate hydratase